MIIIPWLAVIIIINHNHHPSIIPLSLFKSHIMIVIMIVTIMIVIIIIIIPVVYQYIPIYY
jgi:hypothetical protein